MDTMYAYYTADERTALVTAILTEDPFALPAEVASGPLGKVIVAPTYEDEDTDPPFPGFPVWVLTVVHEYGENVEVYTSETAAKAGLLNFVAEWWEDTMGDEEMPEDADAAISAYFEVAGDNGEGCTITQTTIFA